MMQRSLLTLLVLGAGALGLAACGDSGSDSGGGGSATGGDGGGGQVQTTADGGVIVTMKAIAYSPSSITVRPGQRITWRNEDDVLHDVVSTSGERIRSELFPNGREFSFTPTRRGSIQYVCTIHPGMEGSIAVQ